MGQLRTQEAGIQENQSKPIAHNKGSTMNNYLTLLEKQGRFYLQK